MVRNVCIFGIVIGLFISVFIVCGKKLTDKELFEQGMALYNQGKPNEAVKPFEKLVKTYPASTYRSNTVFLLGYINSDDLKDKAKAEKYYKMMVEQYPDCTLTTSAKFGLEMLYKSQAEIDSILFKRLGEAENPQNPELPAKKPAVIKK